MSIREESAWSWIYDLYRIAQSAKKDRADSVHRKLLAHIVSGFEACSGSLALCDEAGDRLTLIAGIDVPPEVLGRNIAMGEGIIGWVARHGEPVLLSGDLSGDTRFASMARAGSRRYASAMCWPLVVDSGVIGALSINRDDQAVAFSEADLHSGQQLINVISLVVDNIRLQQRNRAQVRALETANRRLQKFNAALRQLHEGDEYLRRGGAWQDFYRRVIRDLALAIGADYGAIGFFSDDGDIEGFVCQGLDSDGAYVADLEVEDQRLLDIVYCQRRIVRVDHVVLRECSPGGRTTEIRNMLVLPVVVDNKARGMIFLANKDGDAGFSEHDETLVGAYANDFAHVIERNDLLNALTSGHRRLEEEKRQQQVLIEQLQDAQDQLLQSEKMASIGQLAAGVAHEINNPVGYINSNMGSLKSYVDDMLRLLDAYGQLEGMIGSRTAREELAQLKHAIDLDFLKQDIAQLIAESLEGVRRVMGIVQGLKEFSHVDEAEWQWADLHHGLDSTLNVAHNELKYKAEVVKRYGEIPRVECIASQINQVFLNLLVNAAQAMDTKGTITVETGTRGDDWIWIAVGDTGRGIAEETLSRIFEPFFTTKPVGQGTGLGLSLSYGIVHRHGGNIDVSSAPGSGTRFTVWLPVSQERSVAAPAGTVFARDIGNA